MKSTVMAPLNEDNPYRSPRPMEEREEASDKGRFREAPDPVMAEQHCYLPLRFYLIPLLVPALAWFWLAVNYPTYWAIVNVILIDLGLGLLMTKVVFRFERPLYLWGLVPVFGTTWLLVLWLLFKWLA